jgi:hypothetical protein
MQRAPRLTVKLLHAMASALAAAAANEDQENDHPGVDREDFDKAADWVAHRKYMQTRGAAAKGAK